MGEARIVETGGPDCRCWPTYALAGPGPEWVHERLVAAPSAVRFLRARMRAWVSAVGLAEETAESIVLIVDEAVTNAVEHACPDRTCHVELVAGSRGCGDGVAVLVADTGVWRAPSAPGYRGRGVTLIGQLAQRSTVETTTQGTTVRMCWPHPARGAAVG